MRFMKTLISHTTALEILDLQARCEHREQDPLRFDFETIFDTGTLGVTDEALALLERVPPPLDVLVCSRAKLHLRGPFRTHLHAGALPPDSCTLIDHGVYLCGAPFVFLQLARGRELLPAIKLACYMMGTYSLDPAGVDGIVYRRPLTTIDDLATFLHANSRQKGSGVAAKALKHALPLCASPKEMELALLLTLPARMGGYALRKPQLNSPILLSPEARRLYPHSTCYVDLLWQEAHYGLEFNGRHHYESDMKIGDDEARRLALRRDGYTIESVTSQQLANAAQLDAVAENIAERLRARSSAFRNPRHGQLQKDLIRGLAQKGLL